MRSVEVVAKKGFVGIPRSRWGGINRHAVIWRDISCRKHFGYFFFVTFFFVTFFFVTFFFVTFFLGLCIDAQHRYNIYREVGAADMPIFPLYIGEISAAERSEAAEPKTAPRLVRGLAGGAAGGKKNHAIWLHFPSKSGNNIDYRIVE